MDHPSQCLVSYYEPALRLTLNDVVLLPRHVRLHSAHFPQQHRIYPLTAGVLQDSLVREPLAYWKQ